MTPEEPAPPVAEPSPPSAPSAPKPSYKPSKPSYKPSPAPSTSYYDSKNPIIKNPIEPVRELEASITAGYQSRYYFMGKNQIAAGAFKQGGALSPDVILQAFPDYNFIEPEETDMYYYGVDLHWRGFGVSLRRVEAFEDHIDSFFSTSYATADHYRETIFDINYSHVLHNYWSGTVGYNAQHYDEASFFNTHRLDQLYVTLRNDRYHLLRPSVTFHHFSQDKPLDDGALQEGLANASLGTWRPGATVREGEIITAQLDGGIALAEWENLFVGLNYYVQFGFDNGFNTGHAEEFFPGDPRLSDGFEFDWWQVGIVVPVTFGRTTVSGSWRYNERQEADLLDPTAELGEHYFGVETRIDL
jgi:hypothetical protein